MDDYNRQAAEYVFRANNADSQADEIDLHGLYVKEAIDILTIRIQAAKQRGESHLDVIVGKGLHSANHVAKIKPAVEELCQQHGLRYSVDPHNAGVLVVDLTSSGGEVPWGTIPGRPNKPQAAHGGSGAGQYYQQNQYGHQQQQQQYHQQQQQQNGSQQNPLVKLLCNVLFSCIKQQMR